LAEAEVQAIIPPTVPDHLAAFGCQIGAIVAPQSGGSFTSVIMVTSQFFSGTEVVNHNNLGGLQGGAAGEQFHLTETQHTNNAYTTDKLSAFAATTSAELAGVISDETGEGVFVLGTSPTFTTNIKTPIVRAVDGNGLGLYDDDSNGIFVEDGGQVGVGTSSPSNLLHIYNSAANNALMELEQDNNSYYAGFNIDWVGDNFYIFSGDGNLSINTSLSASTAMMTIIKTTGHIGIGTSVPSGLLDLNVATDADPHFLLSENSATKWDIYNDHTTDALEVYAGATRRYSFGADGTAIADVAWNTFSPKITATGRDLLAVALEDANKPVKPYEGIPVKKADNELFDIVPTEYQEEINKVDEEGNPVLDEDGKPVKEIVTKIKDVKVFTERRPNEFKTEAEVQAEFDKYAKCPAKITIASARYLEYLTGVIDIMQAKIDELEVRIEKLEQKEAMKITNAELARMIESLDKNVTGINTRLDKLNGRSFKNSTDIAHMKGISGVIAFVVSIVTTIIGVYWGTKQ